MSVSIRVATILCLACGHLACAALADYPDESKLVCTQCGVIGEAVVRFATAKWDESVFEEGTADA